MQEEIESLVPSGRLRWYQYRLRTLLIIMTLLAVWMAWISHCARQQQTAVEKIHALGGNVSYDIQKINGQYFAFDYHAIPPGPAWLRKFIGEDYFQNVVYVELGKTHDTDDDLAILQNLPDLEGLALNDTNITGNSLVHLEGLKKLEILILEKTMIDDSGLAHLKDITSLRGLDLNDTKITDAGILNLQKLINLEEWLLLNNTEITDESLKYFKNFVKLKVLSMKHTHVTRKSIENMKDDLPNSVFFGSSH
jgi:hypothetical protein